MGLHGGHSGRPEERRVLERDQDANCCAGGSNDGGGYQAHPAILGYTCAKSGKGVGPHLYKDGVFVGDYDTIQRMHSAGSLQGKLGTNPKLTEGVFGGELPIGTFNCWDR